MSDEDFDGDGPPGHWPYRADLPQRFTVNFSRYQARGGTARPERDVLGFAAGGDDGDISRFLAFTLAFDQIAKEGVAGAVAELGVYRGHTAHALTTFARRLGRHTYLFDTFTGFDPADLVGVDQDVPVGFGDTSLEAVRAFVGTELTTYCEGRFPATASLVPAETTFCLVHLDCDLYAPMLSALEYFYPRMAPGGFMLLHDYSSLAWDGAERAADTFFADKPECLVPMPDGCGTAIVRRQRIITGFSWQDRMAAAAFQSNWLEAGTSSADPLFVTGWSVAEDWGRWGVGEAHVLRLRPPPEALEEHPDGAVDILLEIDVETVLVGTRTAQEVTVLGGEGEVLATWAFTAAENRAIRVVRIPAGPRVLDAGVEVTFRPRAVESPAALTQGNSDPDLDDRLLGVAVHRLRARVAPAPPAMPAPPIEPEPVEAGSVAAGPVEPGPVETGSVATGLPAVLRLGWLRLGIGLLGAVLSPRA
jgi:hypothetical protein